MVSPFSIKSKNAQNNQVIKKAIKKYVTKFLQALLQVFFHLNFRMKSGSALDLNFQFSPLLIRILCDGECSGAKMKAIPSQCSQKPQE